MSEGLSQWIKGHPDHPYAKAKMKTIEEAFASFMSLFPRPYSFQSPGGMNGAIPTCAGTLRPTYLIPATMLPGITLPEKGALIAGFRGFKDFYARQVAEGLKCRGVTLSLPESFQQEVTASALSRLMEKASFRESIGREIRRQLHGEKRVGLPAVLGLRDPVQAKEELGQLVGAEVFEIPTLPPSVPGRRVFNRFQGWLIEKGATWLLGQSVSHVVLKHKRCEAVHVTHPPVSTSYSADRYILATGRFMGGGLAAERDGIREPLFHLAVSQPTSQEEWYKGSFFDDHPFHQAGVMTDAKLRPVDPQGELLLENVWVAGSILAGHNLIAEKSREGIELVTGYMAAKCALQS
jgi:glycerol-3-phosphate dehydrogenase subunit B